MKFPLVVVFAFALMLSASAAQRCVQGTCSEGQGVMLYSDGSQYVGQWQNGRPNGQGAYTMPDGSQYVGEFKNGFPDGIGQLIAADGSESYTGGFKNGLYDGYGIQMTALGVLSGPWKAGKFVGK